MPQTRRGAFSSLAPLQALRPPVAEGVTEDAASERMEALTSAAAAFLSGGAEGLRTTRREAPEGNAHRQRAARGLLRLVIWQEGLWRTPALA